MFDWYNNNKKQVMVGGLAFCIVAMIGLSIYIIIDAKKYKMLLQKLGKVSELNNLKPIESESINIKDINKEIESDTSNILEEIVKSKEKNTAVDTKTEKTESAKGTGKRFKN